MSSPKIRENRIDYSPGPLAEPGWSVKPLSVRSSRIGKVEPTMSKTRTLTRRVAGKYVRRAAARGGDLQWGLDKAEGALNILDDVSAVWKLRGAGRPSVADDYGEAQKAIKAIDTLGKHIGNLKRLQRRQASIVKEGRGRGVRLDPKKKRLIGRVFKLEGLDGNKYFRRAQEGYSKAIDVLQDYGIEMDEVVSSHLFNEPKGQFTVHLAETNPDDIFSPIPITNSMLAVSFHQMQSGKFEVIAYLS
jgi:hypothetical protein